MRNGPGERSSMRNGLARQAVAYDARPQPDLTTRGPAAGVGLPGPGLRPRAAGPDRWEEAVERGECLFTEDEFDRA
jgi:hypothetical protein